MFGLIVAWVLVRYRFPGKRLVDAVVDLPFALPTAVAGIALSALYARNGWLGAPLEAAGIKIAYTPAGVVLALTFIGPALRGAHPAADPGRTRPRRRGSRRHARRHALPGDPPRRPDRRSPQRC